MTDALLALAIFAAALLYSSVGHGGGSGYLAAMALAGLAPAEMRPAALALNVLVAGIGTARFARAFAWPLFWPFALASVPCAALGGALELPISAYRPAVGAVLLFAAARMAFTPGAAATLVTRRPPLALALLCGAGIGLLSGLTGVGGGIFLAPLLLFTRWGEPRAVAAVSAPFILANSLAGLAGLAATGITFPSATPYWGVAAAAGGLIGSALGASRLGTQALLRVLAVVLAIAGAKLALL